MINTKEFTDRINEVCKKYDLPIPSFAFSKRMTRSAGYYTVNRGEYKITISAALYEEFGVERCMTTLNHELAHHYQYIKCGRLSHDEIFMKICMMLGGSVNTRHAAKYGVASIAETRFPSMKYKYICKCGQVYKRSRRLVKSAEAHFCKLCGTKVSDMKLEVIK